MVPLIDAHNMLNYYALVTQETYLTKSHNGAEGFIVLFEDQSNTYSTCVRRWTPDVSSE